MSAYNNTITVVGNVGREAEIKEIDGVGTIAKFPIGVYRSGKGDDKKTDWFFVEAWHDVARGMENIKKGTKLIVKGTMKSEHVNDKNYYSIVASDIGADISISKDDEEPF